MNTTLALNLSQNMPMTLFIATWVVLAAIGFGWLSRESRRVHDRLRGLGAAAGAAATETELLSIRAQVVAFHNAECWHRRFGERARQIVAFIDSKRSALAREAASARSRLRDVPLQVRR